MLGAEIVLQLPQPSQASYLQPHHHDSKKSVQNVEAYRSKDIPKNAHHSSTATVSGVHSTSRRPTIKHETIIKMVFGRCRGKDNAHRKQ